ncbi:MAG: hypothetical protein HUK17_05555, partial [Bacteroidales bacterium]|nr:hypothetical protein [Bacteroidales bacterium]
MANLKEVR